MLQDLVGLLVVMEIKVRKERLVLLELVQAQQIKYLKIILRLNVLIQEQVLLKLK